ncbi:MAG: 1-deoxy-D-xylulose-5-phosphate synthase [Coriobacteriales bacterium]|jgi:1-deoxy-D-xylulose-5-phosphate synthase|nr:1-deoxy-D-xylulose-5-phosphate synthase [Coriobacteriales bacterium]
MPDNLADIPFSSELKNLDFSQLNELAARIRHRLIEVTSVNGGHLASSLGAVELILALHRFYNFPTDRLVFDVGHQAYAHKLLTNRAAAFDTLRTYHGISGFPRRNESPFDTHDAGHASDALSIALGLVLARDLNKGSERIVALVGDAALSGGMAFEALNQIGHLGVDMTIILNDNEMSISRNVGALSLYLGRARTSKPYTRLRDTIEDRVSNAGRFGRFLMNVGDMAKGSFKKLVVPGTLFEDMGIIYIGPIDGHNIEAVSEALRLSQRASGPVLIHAVTQKGRGFAPAEMQPDVFHGVGCYNPTTGVLQSSSSSAPTYTSLFSQAMLNEAKRDPNIVAITAAMADGTGLAPFRDAHPTRFFDVGIAEEHAVALAGGLALGGKLPVAAIYSTFLQRSFDQIVIDVALQEQHVVFCVDRAGLVGEDGSTHHGLFDLAYLRAVPSMRIIAPADSQQLADALHTALLLNDAPIALRYPRGIAPEPFTPLVAQKTEGINGDDNAAAEASSPPPPRPPCVLPPGKAILLREGSDLSLLAIGRMVGVALDAASLLSEQGINASVHNMLWVKPLDEEVVFELASSPLIVTLEEGTILGGFGAAVLETLAKASVETGAQATRVLNIGVPDDFVGQGSIEQLFEELGMTAPQIAERILHVLKGEDTTD